MDHSIDVFNAIASDIGVKRFIGEEEESFCRRVAYSAARFWLLAFCMDDGAKGERGLAKQAINRRLKNWVLSLDRIRSGLNEWFDADGKGIQAVYNRLIDLGDLAPNGFSNSYVATPPSRLQLSESLSCITGHFDPTAKCDGVCGCDMNSSVLSGLVSLVQSKNEEVLRSDSWWIKDCKYLNWEKESGFDDVKFVDARVARWNVNRADVWVDVPTWIDDLTLARVDGDGVNPVLFVATRVRNRVWVSRITWIQAQELFFYLRDKSGNKAIVRYAMVDDLHVKAVFPIGFIPGHINRILDAVGWPIENAVDRFNRITRVEALPLLKELLSIAYVGFEGISDGR